MKTYCFVLIEEINNLMEIWFVLHKFSFSQYVTAKQCPLVVRRPYLSVGAVDFNLFSWHKTSQSVRHPSMSTQIMLYLNSLSRISQTPYIIDGQNHHHRGISIMGFSQTINSHAHTLPIRLPACQTTCTSFCKKNNARLKGIF